MYKNFKLKVKKNEDKLLKIIENKYFLFYTKNIKIVVNLSFNCKHKILYRYYNEPDKIKKVQVLCFYSILYIQIILIYIQNILKT